MYVGQVYSFILLYLFYVESIQWPHFIPGLWIQISNCLVTKFLQRYSITQAYYCHLAIYYIDQCPCLATHTVICTQVADGLYHQIIFVLIMKILVMYVCLKCVTLALYYTTLLHLLLDPHCLLRVYCD